MPVWPRNMSSAPEPLHPMAREVKALGAPDLAKRVSKGLRLGGAVVYYSEHEPGGADQKEAIRRWHEFWSREQKERDAERVRRARR